RGPEGVRGPGLHLAEDVDPPAPHDQVELALTAAPVAHHHQVSLTLVPGRDRVFAAPAQLLTGLRHAVPRPDPYSWARISSTLTSLKVTTRTEATNRAGPGR